MAASAISAASSTETKYPVLINGYLCYSAAEVRAARQMINPSSIDKVTGLPQRSDTTTAAAAANSAAANSATTTANTAALRATSRSAFGDALTTYTAQGASSRDDTSSSRRGSLLDILA